MSDADVTSERPSGWRRWLLPLLVASLALNLLFVGGVIGAKVLHKRHGGMSGADFGLMGFVRELPKDRRDVIKAQIKKARDEAKPLRQAIRSAWQEANDTLTVEPFDKDKFKAAMGKLAEAEATFKATVSNSLSETAASLTAEERKALKEWREKRKGRMFGGGPKGPPDDEPPPDKP